MVFLSLGKKLTFFDSLKGKIDTISSLEDINNEIIV